MSYFSISMNAFSEHVIFLLSTYFFSTFLRLALTLNQLEQKIF